MQSFCLPPVADKKSRVLILGSMPGVASLRAQQYYAHPQNAFWPIMGDLVGASPDLPYARRLTTLKKAGIALWDVLACCFRGGSLDSAIVGEELNDLAGFLAAHPGIARIGFNGAKAAESFARGVDRTTLPKGLSLVRLPSTSPAHAGMSRQKKLAAWRAVVEGL
jgi:TDG/mug DNA glycosylase family protein